MVSRHKTKVFEMSPELKWLSSKPAALRAYEGKWVGILGDRVVAVGDSASEVLDIADAAGLDNPLVTRIGPAVRPDKIVLD
jgi:hypothetical protein